MRALDLPARAVPGRPMLQERAGPWRPALLVWAVAAVAMAAAFWPHPWLRLAPDPDSAMRLVQVRDLLAGQGWFDLTQARLDPPQGSVMHWSRLIDAPLAALILLGGLVSAGAGEALALILWPLLLLLAFIWAAGWCAVALAGERAGALACLLAVLCAPAVGHFLPGRIDHHNAQLVLLLLLVGAAARLRGSAWMGGAAGVIAGAMLAIGLETLPYLAAVAAAVSLGWAAQRQPPSGGTAAFGLAFALASAAFFVMTSPVSGPAYCDAISPVYLVPTTIGGLGLAWLAWAGRAWPRQRRLAGLAGLAALAAALSAALFPHCLAGPYSGLSPELERLWLANVAEAQPALSLLAATPLLALAKILPPLTAVAVALHRAFRREAQMRWAWLTAAALVALGLLIGVVQVRALDPANALAVPIMAVWLSGVRGRLAVPAADWSRQMKLAGAWLAATPAGYLLFAVPATLLLANVAGGTQPSMAKDDLTGLGGFGAVEQECWDPASADALGRVPPGVVLANVFHGPAILALSRHKVVAGPYHRAGDAILATIRAMHGTEAQARSVARQRQVDYLVVCSTSRETRIMRRALEGSFLDQLVDGRVPGWLRPVGESGRTALRIFRVLGP